MSDRNRIYKMYRARQPGCFNETETPELIENFRQYVDRSLLEPLYDILDMRGRLGGFVNISLPPYENTRHEFRAMKKEGKYYSWLRVVD